MKPPAAVIVHSLDQARAALGAGLPVTLLSAPGAGIYAGAGWWRALMQQAGAGDAHILDCGDAPGRALEAARAGQKRVILRADAAIMAETSAIAATYGCAVMAEPPPSLDLAQHGAMRRLLDWLSPCRPNPPA
jgi:hypothetical protein